MTPAKSYDIALVGAGPAGVAAAVAGASAGRRVLLVDAWNRIGGTVTAGMHRCLCGLYSQMPASPLQTLNDGVQRRVVEQLHKRDPASVMLRQMGRACVLEFSTAMWEATLAEMCLAAGVDVRLGTRVVRVHREGVGIVGLELQGDSTGVCEIGVAVDCTGGGQLLQMIGPDALQSTVAAEAPCLAGFCLRLDGLSGDPELMRLQVPYALVKAADEGALPGEARFTMFEPGPVKGQGVCKLAVDAHCSTPGGLDDYAAGVLHRLMRDVPGFAQARIIEKSPRLLERTGYRLAGREILSDEDVLSGRQRGAEAVHAWWPMEWWDPVKGPVLEYPPPGRHYDIPLETLRSAVVPNLLACGACVSATAAAAASLRAAGICLATGDAAGRLAVQSLNED